jgi:hypothetical protein
VGNLTNLSVAGNASVTGTVTATNGLYASASSSANGIGYSSGGSSVTQTGSKTSAVTINGLSGQITTHSSSLGWLSSATFTVNNSAVKLKDVPMLAISSGGGTGRYILSVDSVQDGTFSISVFNKSGSTVSDNIVINFVIIRGN